MKVYLSRYIWLYLILFIYLEPPIIALEYSLRNIHIIFDYMKIAGFGITILLYLINGRTRVDGIKYIIIITILPFFRFVDTAIHVGGNVADSAMSFITIVVPLLILCIVIQKEEVYFANCVANYITVMALVDLILHFIYPAGIYRSSFVPQWLFGNKNGAISFTLCGIAFSVNLLIKKPSFSRIVGILILLTNVFVSSSATAYVGVGLFFLCTICTYVLNKGDSRRHKILNKLFNINTYLIVIIIFALIVVFVGLSNNEILAFIVTKVLHRDLTFTDRTFAWSKSLQQINNHLLVGQGVQDLNTVRSSLKFSHQHNYYLHITYECGIMGLSLFVLLVNTIRKKILSNTNYYYVFAAAFFSYMIMFITEVYTERTYILPFYLLISFVLMQNFGEDDKR